MKKKVIAWLIERFLPEYHLKQRPKKSAAPRARKPRVKKQAPLVETHPASNKSPTLN